MITRHDYDVYEVVDGEEISVGLFFNKHIMELVQTLREDTTLGELEVEAIDDGNYIIYDEGDYVCYKVYLFQ